MCESKKNISDLIEKYVENDDIIIFMGAGDIHKTIESAINNMQQKDGDYNPDKVFIKEAYVDQGPTMKRFRPAAMGRAVRILKRTSNLTIVLSDKR